jgi:hypothetical protein
VPFAGVYGTSGSAPSTRAFEVIVSVAVMATFASLMPASPHTPADVNEFGVSEYCSGSDGRSIVRWPFTLV